MRITPALTLKTPAWGLTGIALLTAAGVGAAITNTPKMILPVAAATGLLVVGSLGRKSVQVFFVILSVALIGYMFQGKGFAYLGFSPLYVGELTLALGVAVLPFARLRWRFSGLELLICAFIVLGLLRTIPYLPQQGIFALRDAALWYYALFAIIVGQLATRERIMRFVGLYARLTSPYVLWALAMSTLLWAVSNSLPHFPGSPLPIISPMKSGDRAIMLAGVAAFSLGGLTSNRSRVWRLPKPIFWSLWLLCAVIVALESRGAFLALAAAGLVTVLLQPSREWIRVGLIAVTAATLLLISNPSINLGDDRVLSVEQFRANVISIFSEESEDESLQGTKDWRLKLWSEIYERVVEGPLFWTGSGFGANIPAEYGHSLNTDEGTVRSPHSVHLAILARMGVPGMLLWVSLLITFVVRTIHAIHYARLSTDVYWRSVLVWLLALSMAAIVNSSFETTLEGPQGAIPFWCCVGATIAVIREQRDTKRASSAAIELESGQWYAYSPGP